MRLMISLALAGAALALPVRAEPLGAAEARAMLFDNRGADVELLDIAGLSAADESGLLMVSGAQPYYGAIALSPDEGLMSEATIAAARFHDTDAASAAALKACEARRQGATPCQVVALIRPKDWEARALQLSAEATAAFVEGFTAGSALAISRSTGQWGIADGAEAAVAACAAKAPDAGDCSVVVQD
jgi:hypothetical protein